MRILVAHRDAGATDRRTDRSVTAAAARWDETGIGMAGGGPGGGVPYLLREGRPVPFPVSERGPVRHSQSETRPGDLLVLASRGLAELRFPTRPSPPEKSIQHFARIAAAQSLPGAFAQLVSEWKRVGATVGPRDVLLLCARPG